MFEGSRTKLRQSDESNNRVPKAIDLDERDEWVGKHISSKVSAIASLVGMGRRIVMEWERSRTKRSEALTRAPWDALSVLSSTTLALGPILQINDQLEVISFM